MLIITAPFSSALLDWEEEKREAQTGESIIVNVKGYEPQILPASVVEDGDVPVYVYLTGITPGRLIGSQSNIEPIYGSMNIKQVYIRPGDEETLNYVRGSPKYIKPRQISLENLGYLIVTLKQIEKEADVPDKIKLNMKAQITFENAERLYSMIEQDLLLPERTDEAAWKQDPNFNDYRFFAGRGAIRATSIRDGSAELTVYGGQDLQWPFTGTPRPLKDLKLNEGETSDPIRMSAASDFMTNAFRVKLIDIIDSAKKRARIRVNVNGEEKEYIVTEGSRLYPGSSLKVTQINVVKEPRTNKVTYEIVVKGPRDTATVSKTFFQKIAEGAADVLGYVSDSAAEDVRDAAGLTQEGSASAETGYLTPSETPITCAGGKGICQSESCEEDKIQYMVSACSSMPGGSGYCCGTESSATAAGSSINFVVMSDMHTKSGGGASLRTSAARGAIAQNPDFVVFTGDITSGNPGETAAGARAMWNLFTTETWEKINDAGITMIPVLGNHDMYGEGQNEYVAYWNQHKPAVAINENGNYPLYYSFNYGSNYFIVLEAGKQQLGSAQMSWLADELGKAKAAGKRIIVFGHLPLTRILPADSGQSGGEQIAPNSQIKSLFKQNNVAAYIHGHAHVFYEGTTDGINVIAAGPVGSDKRNLPGVGITRHMIVDVNAGAGSIVSRGLVEPDYSSAIFDESAFARADIAGFSVWAQGSAAGTSGARVTAAPTAFSAMEQITCASYGARRGLIGNCRQTCNQNEAGVIYRDAELCTNANAQCCILSVFDKAKVASTFAEASREESEIIEQAEAAPAAKTAAPAISPGAGEGICRNKVLLFREGGAPEQWLKVIKESTQEMVYCTAAEEFKRVAELYFGIKDDKGVLYEDRANYKLGEIYYWLGDTETALKYFRLAIKNNMGEFIPLAKTRITELEEDAKLHTRYKIGEFEDNGVSIRVMVLDMPFQAEAEQPSATIEVEIEGTKKLKAGNGIFSMGITETGEDGVQRQYNWLVRDISPESVVIEKKYRAAPPRGYRANVKALPLNSDVRLDYSSSGESPSYRTVRLKSVDLKKYAIVTVIPGTGAPLVSNTNFTIHIPVEKRAIQWTPDEISDKINSTQAVIEDLDEVISALNNIVVVWKKVCLVTFGYLTLKNSFFGGMSRTQARRFAMHGPDGNSGWDAYCRQNSGEGRMYEDYNECVIDNSGQIESTIDASQDAINTVNKEMENYKGQPWYRNITSKYTDLSKYEDYMGDDLYSPQQLRDYRYWQLMKDSPDYSSLSGKTSGKGYEYNLRSEVDTKLSSMRLENTNKQEAYLAAVSDVEAHYKNFGALSEQDKATLFSDLYKSHLAEPDTRSGDFPYIETIGATPLATIRREGRQLYSNTPHGKIILQEATVNDYQRGLADAMSAESPRYLEGMDEKLKADLTAESARVEAAYERNPNAPLRTNQGNVYVDEEGNFYVAMTTAYATGQTSPTYNPRAIGEFYSDGKPYCIPTCTNGNYVKVLDFYKDGSPSVIQEWNVGEDGLLCNEDDVLVQHQSMLERPGMESTHRRLIEQATRVGKHSEGQVLSMCGRNFGVSTSRANLDASRSSATCYDVMDPDDCRMLFGVCDPVMCPPSRFNMGGAWQVNDVVQTGLIGSIVLGLHNFDIPYEPVPICLTGVLAGLQNIKSVLRGYVKCLKTAQVQGVSVGICDKIRSVFICELIWKEAMAIINMKGGIFNWISQTFLDQKQGGGEYLTFDSSIQNVEDSVSFFTKEYATTAFASYQSRSIGEIGTEICKQAIFGKLPAFGEFFDQLAQPESPPQYTAIVDESGYSETQQLSRYGVFYHVYAGEDNPATYSVFLKNSITNDVFYATERCEGRQGSIEKGGIASFNLDCIAPKGYDNVCITLNGNTECGFGKVSTDFALDYLSDLIVSDEAQRQIKSEEDCVASVPRTSPSLGSIPLPEKSGLLSSGVQRVCSLQNPGQGTNPTDWREVGTCGKDSSGRSMGKCWIDMRTVTINDADRMREVSNALDETGFRSIREEMGIDALEYKESVEELRKIEKITTDSCGGIANAMSEYKYLETRTITPKIAAQAGYKYAELMDKAAKDCAQKDPKREFSRLLDRFEYDLEALYFIYLDKFETDIAPFLTGRELPAAFVSEYRQKVKELYDVYKNNLAELRSTLAVDEAVYNQYVKNFETLYQTSSNMNEPFVFRVAVSEEAGQQARIEENKCNDCGMYCTKPQCHNQGMCYYVPRTMALSAQPLFNGCHTCSKLTSCSEMNNDKNMCESRACTGKAKNGEGISCKYDTSGQCVEVERRAESAAQSSEATEAASTGSSGTAIVPVAGMQIAYDNAGARTAGNIVDYGSYVDLDPETQKNRVVTSLMKGLVSRAAPDTIPTGASTFAEGTITATVYYTADCNDKPGWADGSKWYSGMLDDNNVIKARPEYQSAAACQTYADCSSQSRMKNCKTVEDKKICWYGACNLPMSDRGFYEVTLCEGSSICRDKVYSYTDISKTAFEGGVAKTTANERGYTKTGVKPETHRTIAVNPDEGTGCFIPYGSRVYLKFNEGNPLNGWYFAEDTGGAFRGKYKPACKIDMYGGVGARELGAFMALNNKPSNKWRPEIWVYPPRATGSTAAASTGTPTGSPSAATSGTTSTGGNCITAGGTCKAGCTDRYETQTSGSCSTGVCCRPKARAGVTPNARTERVGAIGDSITQDGGYVNYLNMQCSAANIDFFEHGISGQGSTAIARRFDSAILANNYNDVIIMAGVNNICGGKTTVERDLQAMYKKAKDAGLRVIALTITPWKGTTGTFGWTAACQRNQEIVNRWIMAESNADVKVDVYNVLNDPANPGAMKTEYHASGQFLHPNAAGQEAIGKAIRDAAYPGCRA
ncbi:MAG: metallophosphoesterase [Nanoarchaeota archaeon]|nr:metallophosphoesterase [Nanoarchaeota archaeon]